MATATTNYLITGATRGLGLGLTTALLQRPSTTVVAGVRDPQAASAKALTSLPTAAGSRAVVVKIDASSETDAADAAAHLETAHGITSLDVVIANAGVASHFGPAAETPAAALREHFDVNAVGPLLLFQAVRPMLQRSGNAPRFVAVSSCIASMGDMSDYRTPVTAYGASKAALNYVLCKLHWENEWLTAFPIHPGWVQTDMGNTGARALGLEQAPITVEASVAGMLDKIDNATRDKTSGTFQTFDGSDLKW